MIEYHSIIVLCDNGNDSMDQFFMNDTDQSSNNDGNTVFSDSSSYTNVYCSTLLDKYKIKAKRNIYWFVTQKGKGNYPSYEEFKKTWNPNMDIISELKKQLKSEVEEASHKVSLTKRSISWFIKGSKPGGGRGL